MRSAVRSPFVASRRGRPAWSSRVVISFAGLLALLAGCGDDSPTAPRLAPTIPDHTLVGGSGVYIFPLIDPSVGFQQIVGDARGLNSTGQVTGGAFSQQAQEFVPYRWSAAAGLALLPVFSTSYGTDINDAGVIAGTKIVNLILGLRGFVATATGSTTLSILPGGDPEGSSRAAAINNAGDVAGESPSSSGWNHAVRWASDGTIQDLGTLGGSSSAAVDINNAGQIIGSSQIAGDAATHYFLWSSGTGMVDLNATVNPNITSVVEINDAGQIVGTIGVSNAQSHAFLYTPGSGLLDLGTFGGPTSTPTGLNNKGNVVGMTTRADGTLRAFLWTASDGMEDVTTITAIPEIHRLNDNLQTLASNYSGAPSGTSVLPRLVQLSVSPTGNKPPVAAFTANCTGQSTPNQCAFDATSSTDDVAIMSYRWDWGNGRSETRATPTVRNTWASPGVYNITLTVTDGAGLTSSVTKAVTVNGGTNQPPTIRLATQTGTTIFQGQAIFLNAFATDPEDGNLPASSLSWTSSIDGALGTGTPSVTTLSVGTHTITVAATDSRGAITRASLIVYVVPVPSNQPPVAFFTNSCTGQSRPHQCAFDASASWDDAGIVSYKWDWGNGRSETKTGSTTRNTWASAGTYWVSLTVTDASGLTSTMVRQVTVP